MRRTGEKDFVYIPLHRDTLEWIHFIKSITNIPKRTDVIKFLIYVFFKYLDTVSQEVGGDGGGEVEEGDSK
ncbi:hypothetical protein DRN87_02210 [Candidatus Geothermarchaeota archaeon]|nr:MAG: hypothetical protein DRN87_02210 [Candidatus Geothermarchaeota archaeon]